MCEAACGMRAGMDSLLAGWQVVGGAGRAPSLCLPCHAVNPASQPASAQLTLGDLQPAQLHHRGLRGGGGARRPPHRRGLLLRRRGGALRAERRLGGWRGRCGARLRAGAGVGAQRDGGARRGGGARGLGQPLGRAHLLAQTLQRGAIVRQVVLLRADDGAGAAHSDVAHGLLRREAKVLDHVGADQHAGAAQPRLAVHLQGRAGVGGRARAGW